MSGRVSPYVQRLDTKCKIKIVSLHVCMSVCVCVCVLLCTLIAVADMASCLVRLITPLSAALGSMCRWIPQQRSSVREPCMVKWLITDAVSCWLYCDEEEGKDRDSFCMFLSELNYKTSSIYCTDLVNDVWLWEKLPQRDPTFKKAAAMYVDLHAKWSPNPVMILTSCSKYDDFTEYLFSKSMNFKNLHL